MIPDTELYKNTTVSSMKTMDECRKMLKKFNINQMRWTQESEKNSFLEFIITEEEKPPVLVKINVPFIEKETGKKWEKIIEYHEERSFRFFFHYLKGLLGAKETGISSIYKIFMGHIVTQLKDGSSVTLGEQLDTEIAQGHMPAIKGFEVTSERMLPPPEESIKGKNVLKKL